jgi:hypothetical protein
VSTYIFDKKYNLCVFQLNLTSNTSLKNLVKVKNEVSRKPITAIYSGLPGYNFFIDIKAGKQDSVSNLDFKNSGGEALVTAKNDTVVSYDYKFETFSLSYNHESYDIIARADSNAVPASIMFIEKSKKIYVVLLTLTEGGGPAIPPGLLLSMIKK